MDTLEGFSNLEVSFPAASRGGGILNAVNAGEVDLGLDLLVLQASGNVGLDQVLDLYGESVPFGPGVDAYLAWLTHGGGLDQLKRILVQKHGYDRHLEIVPVIANTGQSGGLAGAAEAECAADKPAEHRTSDSEEHGDDDAARIEPGHHQLGQGSHHKTEQNPAEDEHRFRNVSVELWETGRLHQPRQFGYHPRRMPYYWLETVLPDSELDSRPAVKEAWNQFQVIAGLTNVKLDSTYS